MSEEQSSSARDPDLLDFNARCVDKDTDFETFSASVNRVSLRNANITSMEIVDRATPNSSNGSTYRHISFSVTVPEGHPEIWSVLQHSRVDDLPDLASRVQGALTSNSKGDQYAINITMVKGRDRRAEAVDFVVLRAEFPKLRVYHVLDLLRLFSIEFSKHQDDAHASWKNDKTIVNPLELALFPLAVAHVLGEFTSSWGELTIPEPARPEPAVYWKIVDVVADYFIGRWCSPVPEGSPSKRRLHSRPTISGPFFYFDNSLLREMKATTVVRISLSDFCDHIRGPSDPPEAYAKFSSLKRYQTNKGFKHQFVMLHAELDVPGCPKRDFWIRIDRSSHYNALGPCLTKPSNLPPEDKVQLSTDPTPLLPNPETHTVLAEQRYSLEERATLRELTKALKIFNSVSTQCAYLTVRSNRPKTMATLIESHFEIVVTVDALHQENCYYLATLVQELLALQIVRGMNISGSSNTWAAPTKTGQSFARSWDTSQSNESPVKTANKMIEYAGEGAPLSIEPSYDGLHTTEDRDTASTIAVYGDRRPRSRISRLLAWFALGRSKRH